MIFHLIMYLINSRSIVSSISDNGISYILQLSKIQIDSEEKKI